MSVFFRGQGSHCFVVVVVKIIFSNSNRCAISDCLCTVPETSRCHCEYLRSLTPWFLVGRSRTKNCQELRMQNKWSSIWEKLTGGPREAADLKSFVGALPCVWVLFPESSADFFRFHRHHQSIQWQKRRI